MEYDQKVIIKFLLNERADARDIADRRQADCRQTAGRLQAQFGEHVYKFRTVQFWVIKIWLVRQDLHDQVRTGRLPLDDLDDKILAILDKSLFESARSITETLRMAYSIVLLHLYDSIDFKSFHLYWVPNLLTHHLREKRKEYAKAMLPFLHTAERDGWHHLVTDDESWFFLNTSLSCMWTLSRDNIITKPRLAIQNKKVMFTIIWNPNGFSVVDRFPNDIKTNGDCFVTNTLIPLQQAIFSRGRTPHQKQLMVRLDNCSVHTNRTSTDWLEEHGIGHMLHLSYSPDLVSVTSICFPQ
jgi:hypothetical protein